MPLLPGKENFWRNVEVEMQHGKSKKQSLAIAYSVLRSKKRSKK